MNIFSHITYTYTLTLAKLKVTFNFRNMIICLCRSVSERQIEHTVAEGATSVEDVTRSCGAGSDCGSCRQMVTHIIRRGHEAADEGFDGLTTQESES